MRRATAPREMGGFEAVLLGDAGLDIVPRMLPSIGAAQADPTPLARRQAGLPLIVHPPAHAFAEPVWSQQ